MRRATRMLWIALVLGGTVSGSDKIVIAHRGASGYLPEHTLEAKALAYGLGADYIEQDVVLSRDDVPIVMHDVHLDTVTDVAARFPDRAREDGRYYAIDFTLPELKSLRVTERVDLKTGQAVYASRFPLGKSRFQLATLAEEIELIQGLNHSMGREVGIYPEIKAPAWHRRAGKDISRIVLEVLSRYEYGDRDDAIYVQCFDPNETKRLRDELNCQLKLVQLIGENHWKDSTDYDAMRTPQGLREIASYADGIGPAISHIIAAREPRGSVTLTPLVAEAHKNGLVVHPYTLRADSLPRDIQSVDEALSVCFDQARIDGIFTDFPDVVVEFLRDK